MAACGELLSFGARGQDECWEELTGSEQSHMQDGGYTCCTTADVLLLRHRVVENGVVEWKSHRDRDSRRLLTAIHNLRLRSEFCRLWEQTYPDDKDNGCPADQPPPATIVTENGDVPLTGLWPK